MTARRLLTALAAVLATAVAPGAAHAVTAANNIASAPSITGAGPHAVAYDTDSATLESGEPNHWNADYASSVWVKWTPTTTVNMRLDNCGAPASVGTKARIYAGPSSSVTMAKLYPLTTGADSGDIPYNDCEGNIQTLKAQANQTYYIAVVRSKYMQTSDPGGTLYVEQNAAKPVVAFKSPPTQFGATAKVQFSSPDAVGFTCKLDGNPTYCPRSGDDGTFQQGFSDHKTHTLSVVARNEFLTYGNTYIWSFNADGLAPDTVIDSPAPTTLGAYAVQFHASEAGATFKCQLVGETQPEPCTSPWTTLLATYVAGHTVRIIASDKWGNADKTPADQKIYVTPPSPVPPKTPVQQQPTVQQQPVVQPQQPVAQQPPVVQTPPPYRGPCATKARGGRLTKRGMRVLVAGDTRRACVVTLELRAGRRALTRQVRTVAAGGSVVVVLKPKVKAPKGAKVRLVTAAR